MPPKFKFSKKEIVDAALQIAKERGMDAVTARDVGAFLGTSSKPVYTAFQNMSELKALVIKKAYEIYCDYQSSEIKRGEYPEYKAMGMAYIRFAAEEKNLFKLLFMRNREQDEQKGCADSSYNNAVSLLVKRNGLSPDASKLFHTEMWIFTHGIATMLATSYLDLDFATIGQMLTDAYNALKTQYPETEEK